MVRGKLEQERGATDLALQNQLINRRSVYDGSLAGKKSNSVQRCDEYSKSPGAFWVFLATISINGFSVEVRASFIPHSTRFSMDKAGAVLVTSKYQSKYDKALGECFLFGLFLSIKLPS